MRSIRKRDLTQALENLKDGEENLRQIEGELAALEGDIASIQDRLKRDSGPRQVLAGDLEAEMILSGRLARERVRLLRIKTGLEEQRRKALGLVDNLKEAAAKAKRALNAIEDEGGFKS